MIEQIKAEGTYSYKLRRKPSGRINCADGFTMSVQAGFGAYCTPRPVGYDYQGPYTAAEVYFPSERPEPWDQWERFCESPDDPTDTVYGYVPFALIEALIELHGGEVTA
jgi:hypothetical protein